MFLVRIGQRNDIELIPTVKIETRHPIERSFGNEFPSIYNHCGVMAAWSRKTLKKIRFICRFLEKRPPYGKMCNILFRKNSSRHRSTCCVQISWNLADGKSVKSCVIYLTKNSTRSPALASARIAPKTYWSQPQTMYSECSRFHPNRFTFAGAISERAWKSSERAQKWIKYSAEA